MAEELDISRFRVARLLDAARRDGTVRLEIRTAASWTPTCPRNAGINSDCGTPSCSTLSDDAAIVLARLEESTAELLREITAPEDVIGSAGLLWGIGMAAAARVRSKSS